LQASQIRESEWRQADSFLWIDGEDVSDDDLEWIKRAFDIHPIALEDYNSPKERARIDRYEEYFSIVFFALSFSERERELQERSLTLFVGCRFLITLHPKPFPEIEEAKKLWERDREQEGFDVGLALYTLLDVLIDDYFPLIDQLAEEVEDVEDEIMRDARPVDQERIFQLKRQLFYLRRAVGPERDVLNVLLRRELPLFTESVLIYLQDLYDHIMRALDSIDAHRDLLAGSLDLYVSVNSNRLATAANRLNETMQTLAAWSIILMSASLVAGIYGMNFGDMPELKWKYGYPGSIALMLLIGAGLYRHFRRLKWL
jgi:magnesium transporter